MVHSVALLFPAAALAMAVFSPTTVDGIQDLLGSLGRLQNAVRPRHCAHLYEAGQKVFDVFTIYHKAASESGQLVYCLLGYDKAGWTVILKRDHNENIFSFYKNWTEYASGFGSPEGEYWIGNRALHALTSGEEEMALQIWLHKPEKGYLDIDYGRFKISSEEDGFRISVSDYKGPKGWDTLTRANGQPFQTFDRYTTKNNKHVNCASVRRGAWWYESNCEGPNLTGVNFDGKHYFPGTGVQWLNHSFEGVDWSTFSHAPVYMLIKPAGSGRNPLRR